MLHEIVTFDGLAFVLLLAFEQSIIAHTRTQQRDSHSKCSMPRVDASMPLAHKRTTEGSRSRASTGSPDTSESLKHTSSTSGRRSDEGDGEGGREGGREGKLRGYKSFFIPSSKLPKPLERSSATT